MTYRRLSKEQFEELHEEFIRFLANQSITSEEWTKIKDTSPEVAEQELDVFSDLIWVDLTEKNLVNHFYKMESEVLLNFLPAEWSSLLQASPATRKK